MSSIPLTSRHFNNSSGCYVRWLEGWRLFVLLFLIACLIFGPLYNAGFVTDFLGWLECRETVPFWKAYGCFGNRGLYFIPFALLAFLTDIFWLHPLPWFLVWTGMHTLNAYLLVDLARRSARIMDVQVSHWTPIVIALIFLLHPWQVEVLAWKACVNYLFSCFWMLLILKLILQWKESGHRKYYWISIGLYVAFLFTLEFAILFPVVVAALVWQIDRVTGLKGRIASLAWASFPFAVAIVLWLLANHSLIGVWIGHYGSDTHLSLDAAAIGSALWKYLVKIFGLTRFLDFNLQTRIYSLLDSSVAGYIMIGLVVGLLFSLVGRKMGGKPGRRFLYWLFFSGLVCLVPVANLYFYYLQNSENDRYTYLSIAFLACWFVILLWQRRYIVWKALVLVYLGFCIWGTLKLVHTWERSTKIYWSHLKDFPEVSTERTFLLNVPDNFKGTFMFRSIGRDASLDECMDLIMGKPLPGKVYEIFQYNMTDVSNDFITSWESDRVLKVEFAQWGNWWWRNGIGASEYSTEEYIAIPSGKFYTVEFKNTLTNATILLYTPSGWRTIGPPNSIH